jgi:DNA-binding response OmpR family regulator
MNRILFLASDPIIREKNIEFMRQNGLDADGSEELLEGLLKLDKNGYDVVIIDDELQDINGYEACIKVRQQYEISIILLGTVPESEAWSRIDELGFDLYLKKPVSPRELLARVKALIRRPLVERKAGGGKSPEVPSTLSIPDRMQQVAGSSTKMPVQNNPPVATQRFTQQEITTGAAPGTKLPVDKSEDRGEAKIPQHQVFNQPRMPEPLIDAGRAESSSTPTDFSAAYSREPVTPVPPPPSGPPDQQYTYQQSTTQTIKPSTAEIPESVPVYYPAEPSTDVLADARIIKLVEALVNGKLADINPVVDFNLKMGFAYPAVDSLLDTSDLETLKILENLAAGGILIKEPYERFYVDPDNMFQLVPMECCPHCDNCDLVKGQLVEHFACGYVGLDKDFKQDSRYVCPKCRKDLRLIGTDYRNIGIHYRCESCNEIFTTPVIKWRNLKTRKVWNSEELREIEVYSYRFSPDKRGWLEFQLKPKAQLVDFLRSRGYQVQELAQMTGRSGAVHTIDVMAIRDDVITRINLGIGLLVANTGEPEVGLDALFRYDTRTYDVGINYKVVIVIPKLSTEAMNFARRQMIRVFEAKTLASVVSNITGTPPVDTSRQDNTIVVDTSNALGNARSILTRFLRNRGYEVYEQALIVGKSGVEHIFDIFARRDDRIIIPTIAVGIAISRGNQPVEMDEISRFDAAAFDSGIKNKVFVGIPYISLQAKQFARQQKIDILEQQDLNKIM